jgi:hypothetical protein
MSGSRRVSRAPSEAPRAGGLPLCAVSFLFRFPGPFQRVEAPAAPLPQPFPELSQCVGKRVRRHIEKRQLVPAAVGFPIHRHIEGEVGSRRTRFRGHVGDFFRAHADCARPLGKGCKPSRLFPPGTEGHLLSTAIPTIARSPRRCLRGRSSPARWRRGDQRFCRNAPLAVQLPGHSHRERTLPG